jgi:uncharacterized protein YjbI with pentapeptide repeats
MKPSALFLSVILLLATNAAHADIYRWDNGQVIPGTEGITPGPGVQLGHTSLENANLTKVDLSGGTFEAANLSSANFSMATLRNAWFWQCTLTNANLTGAVIEGADFGDTTSRGFTKEQLYSTRSYQAKSLTGIVLQLNDLTGWDLSGQDLTNAVLRAELANVDLTDATIAGAQLGSLTREQLYSTASYKNKVLSGIGLQGDLSGWDMNGQDLTHAFFGGSNLTNANFAGSNLSGAIYVARSKGPIFPARLTNANFTGSIVGGASFWRTTETGFTKEQLYSTASYKNKDLRGIDLKENDLSRWDFRLQNLAGAELGYTKLASAELSGANLTNSSFNDANLTGANLVNARLTGADLSNANLTSADLRGAYDIDFVSLGGGFHVTPANAILPDGSIVGLNLDQSQRLVVRDDNGVPDPAPKNWLTPRTPFAVGIHNAMVVDGGVLELRFESDLWNSLISFEPGIPIQLGGTLELTFADDVDVVTQVGRTLRIFDWTGVSPTGTFTVSSPYSWDLSKLYTTGEITLLAVPEPSTLAVFVAGFYFWQPLAAGRLSKRRHRVEEKS